MDGVATPTVVTVVALVFAALVGGYAWSEWIAPRPPVVVAGWLWKVEEYADRDRDGIVSTWWMPAERRLPVAATPPVAPSPSDWDTWPHAGLIHLIYTSHSLPGRTRDVRPLDLIGGEGHRRTAVLRIEPTFVPSATGSRQPVTNTAPRYVLEIPFADSGERTMMFSSPSTFDAFLYAMDILKSRGLGDVVAAGPPKF